MRINYLFALALIVACGRGKSDQKPTPEASARGADSARVGRVYTGPPSGYVLQLDDRTADTTAVSYRTRSNGFEIIPGPAHILYAPADTLSGAYVIATSFTQLAQPEHPEAFGLFVGGTNLGGPAASYLYFMVRGTGEFLVKVREGAQSRDLIGWTAHSAVRRPDASGRVRYRLAIQIETDSLRFLVDGLRVASVGRAGLPANGIFGIRVNHNLHLRVEHIRRTFR